MLKLKVLGRIVESGLVAVIRADNPDEASRIADAYAKGGVAAVEITFTVPGTAGVIESLAKRYGSSEILIGAGTVLDPETARLCNRYQIPYMPGAGTVGEIIEGMECGADIIKVFPGETLGPAFVKAVKGPLPQASLMTTGGVSLETVGAWIKAGCVAVGVGGSLTRAPNITELAKRFIEEIRRARA